MSCKSSVSKIAAEFSPFVFLPLSTRAYFKGRAYIKIILKNHARSYFAGRSYYRGNTVTLDLRELILTQCGRHVEYFKKVDAKLTALWYLT